jgi:transcriptional regulator with XRE-family HTH domain
MSRSAPDAAKVAQTKTLRQAAGRWLKATREQAGLTQAQLSEQVGLRYYTFVSQDESGVGRLPIETQAAWAKALRVDEAVFAKTLLAYYEPELHRLLFGSEASLDRATA